MYVHLLHNLPALSLYVEHATPCKVPSILVSVYQHMGAILSVSVFTRVKLLHFIPVALSNYRFHSEINTHRDGV